MGWLSRQTGSLDARRDPNAKSVPWAWGWPSVGEEPGPPRQLVETLSTRFFLVKLSKCRPGWPGYRNSENVQENLGIAVEPRLCLMCFGGSDGVPEDADDGACFGEDFSQGVVTCSAACVRMAAGRGRGCSGGPTFLFVPRSWPFPTNRNFRPIPTLPPKTKATSGTLQPRISPRKDLPRGLTRSR